MSEERDERADAVDALIDEAARSLTRLEPPLSLRARVRTALDTAPRHRLSVWRPALSGAAIVVIGAVLLWRLPFTGEPVAPPPIPPRVERVPVPPRTEAPPSQREGAMATEAETVARREPALPRTIRVASREPGAPPMDPLPPIDPIVFDPVESSAVAAIERLPAPMPLEIERLEIGRIFE